MVKSLNRLTLSGTHEPIMNANPILANISWTNVCENDSQSVKKVHKNAEMTQSHLRG